ncbi:hypothetical protein BY458DRAFT_433155 [Sporodiniella umbellata]|nr:hypothetical protein BY458DRAFT_433155 [Sporodiniella umbellata]
MPTLDQIKQLIEIAKQQIALKDQEMQTAAPSVIFAPPTAEELVEEDKNSVKEENTEESVTTLEAYAAADGIDLKKLSSKERRQLRNKLSARNFRVRRKEYITSLEEQVAEQKKATEQLRQKLNSVEDENKTLKKEMDLLKRQNQQLQSSARLLPKTNMTKDISPLDSCRQQDHPYHTSILVSNAIMPSWDLNLILQEKENPILKQLAGQFLLFMMQMLQERPKKSLEDLYDILIQDSLINNPTIDPSFRWSDSFVN